MVRLMGRAMPTFVLPDVARWIAAPDRTKICIAHSFTNVAVMFVRMSVGIDGSRGQQVGRAEAAAATSQAAAASTADGLNELADLFADAPFRCEPSMSPPVRSHTPIGFQHAVSNQCALPSLPTSLLSSPMNNSVNRAGGPQWSRRQPLHASVEDGHQRSMSPSTELAEVFNDASVKLRPTQASPVPTTSRDIPAEPPARGRQYQARARASQDVTQSDVDAFSARLENIARVVRFLEDAIDSENAVVSTHLQRSLARGKGGSSERVAPPGDGSSPAVMKIKLVGDTALLVAGIAEERAAGEAALRQHQESAAAPALTATPHWAHLALVAWAVRHEIMDYAGIVVTAGIHVGPIAAGVIGDERLIYDVFGDVVNTASRIVSSSPPSNGGVFVSAACVQTQQRSANGVLSAGTEHSRAIIVPPLDKTSSGGSEDGGGAAAPSSPTIDVPLPDRCGVLSIGGTVEHRQVKGITEGIVVYEVESVTQHAQNVTFF